MWSFDVTRARSVTHTVDDDVIRWTIVLSESAAALFLVAWASAELLGNPGFADALFGVFAFSMVAAIGLTEFRKTRSRRFSAAYPWSASRWLADGMTKRG